MSDGRGILIAMSAYPKHYEHKKNDKLPNRVANNPTDAVNLEARGYTEVKVERPKVEAKSAPSTQKPNNQN